MGDHGPGGLERQPCRHNVFVGTGGEVSEPIEAASDSLKPSSRARVVAERAPVDARRLRLACCKVARLLLCNLVELVMRR